MGINKSRIYLRPDGSIPLTADWDIGNGRMIEADKIQARDADGLALYEDGGTGIFIEDGGYIGMFGQTNPAYRLHLGHTTFNENIDIILQNDTSKQAGFIWRDENDVNIIACGRITGTNGLGLWSSAVGAYWMIWDNNNARVGIGGITPLGTLHVQQSSTVGAIPVLQLGQADIDYAYTNYAGVSAVDGSRSLSSNTGEAASKAGAIRIQINGTDRWVRFYNAHN